MDMLLKRGLCAIVFFVGGINLLGYGMISNGYDSPRNPAWLFFASVFDFEKGLLIGVAWTVGLAAAVVILVWLIGTVISALGASETGQNGGERRSEYGKSSPQTYARNPEWRPNEAPYYPPEPRYPEATRAPLPEPEPPELTPEEVKEKAIQEILRRW